MATKKVAAKSPKTVALAVVEQAPNGDNTTPTTKPGLELVPAVEGSAQNNDQKSLYVKVTTTDYTKQKGVKIGERIVDMYHFGTRNWFHSHMWWAMHNGHLVESETATAAEVDAYLAEQKQKLADKFNGTTGT